MHWAVAHHTVVGMHSSTLWPAVCFRTLTPTLTLILILTLLLILTLTQLASASGSLFAVVNGGFGVGDIGEIRGDTPEI